MAVAAFAVLVLAACGSGPTAGRGHGSESPNGFGRHAVVAFIGDSYTVGNNASDPTHRWSSLVARHFGWVERNFGQGGTGYAAPPPYLARLAAVVESKPSAVVVSGGFNDLYHGVAEPQFRQAVLATFAALRRALPNAHIVAVRPFYPATPPPPIVALFAADVRRAAVAVGAIYLDIGSPLTGRPAAMAPDLVHPSDSGYSLLAVAIEKALTK